VKCFLGEKFSSKINWYETSTLNFINERFPNTFVAVGNRDSLLSQSQKMRDTLQGLNVAVEYREYENSHHGWYNWFWTTNAKRLHKEMIAWLKRSL
jgi:acetyl esterase/lipase